MAIPPIAPAPLLNLGQLLPSVASTFLMPEAGQALVPQAQAFNLDLATLTSIMPTDTALLQTNLATTVADTTLMQAEVNAGAALATDAQAVVPAPVLPPVPYLDQVGVPDDNLPPDFRAEMAGLAAGTAAFRGEMAALDLDAKAFQAELAAAQPDAAALVLPGPAASEALAVPTPVGVQATLPPLPQADAANPLAGSAVLQTQAAAAPAVDDQAEAIVSQAAMVLQAQDTLLAINRNGDVGSLLAALPAGATAALMGGGWAWVPAAADHMQALWSFQFPFYGLDIPAVAVATRAEPSGEEHGHPVFTGRALTTYNPHGKADAHAVQYLDSTVDLLD